MSSKHQMRKAQSKRRAGANPGQSPPSQDPFGHIGRSAELDVKHRGRRWGGTCTGARRERNQVVRRVAMTLWCKQKKKHPFWG